jgi:hypothetical protein
MPNQKALQLQIDSEHCRAICEEIGERLRVQLRNETGEMPPLLRLLIDRLAELDREQAPSIVPAMDDMILQSAAA